MIKPDKVVLITGASGGIGAATAKEIAKSGALVLLVARNETKLKNVVDEIIAEGGQSKYYTADLSDFKRVQELATQIENEVGT
ncbi:MAG: SDR family NAD(P)-dependent oxidoreductase, partial [Draconibacterium sp.]|nr:SDR family NAD(P)-dependent oxidoreductase [Draconibacterium sp.]